MRPLLTTLVTDDAHEIICEAYTYGYPLVLMDVTRADMTDVSSADDRRAPPNQFAHGRTLPRNRLVHLHTDMLSSAAWVNLGREPVVLSLPDMGGRYYSVQVTDGWTNVCASLGSRTTGNRRTDVAIVGPRWSGAVQAGLQVLEAPTDMVWVVGRFETSGERDYPAVHALQHQITLTPLGRWSRGAPMLQAVLMTGGIDHKVTPAERVAKMNASEFFARLNALMIDNPPGAGDWTALNHLAPIGVGPGLPFDVRHDPIVARSVDASARTALARIVIEAKRPSGQMVHGWWTPLPAGRYADDYMRRAVVALANLGASLPEDGVYLRADVDSEEHPLSGADRYVLRFASGELPPARGSWSIAIYNSRQALVPNPIHRHAFTNRDRLAVGADGSVTLHLHHTSPGRAHESNWLPTPLDHFTVVIRVYWPRREVLNHRWRPPAIHRVR